jgi:hypothetical protein
MDLPQRFEIPGDYIRRHYAPDDWLAAVLIYRGDATVRHEFARAAQIAAPKYQAHLRAANASGADIYLSVNTLKPGARSRTKADIDEVRHLYLDIDVDGDDVLANMRADASVPPPNSLLSSSPGKYQLLWNVEGFGKDEAEAAVRGLAAKFNADQAVWDCARILRIPGFRNCKYATRHYVRETESRDAIYAPKDFPVFADLPRAAPAMTAAARPAGGSQSERDWAYALRKLKAGISPTEIQARIAEYRAGTKARPEYYAHRTVARAQAKLLTEKPSDPV